MSKAAKARNAAYQKQFNLPETEVLIDEFNCALQQKILIQGKLFISQNFACFYSNIFGVSETIKVLPASDITGVQLAKILFIPNSIKVFLTYETYFFASFLHRDDAYRMLTKISRGESIAHMGAYGSGGKENATLSPGGSDDADGESRTERDSRNGSSNGGGGGSDDDGHDDGGMKGHHRRTSSSSQRPRSPANSSKIKHESLLTHGAKRLQQDKEAKRKEELKDAKKNLKKGANEESDDDAMNSDNEDDEPVTPPRGKNGKATAASSSTSKLKRSPQPPIDEDDEAQLEELEHGRSNGKNGNKKKPAMIEDEEDFPPPRKGTKDTKSTGKNGKSSSSSNSYSQHSSFSLPKLSQTKLQTFYQADFAVVDSRVVEIQAKFKTKPKPALDAPESKRRLIFQGAMKRQGKWSIVDRWCFLFHDFFLFTEYNGTSPPTASEERSVSTAPSSATSPSATSTTSSTHHPDYKPKQQINLKHLIVDMRPPSYQVAELKKTKLSNAFRLLDNNPAGPPCQYICSTVTLQENFTWAKKFTEGISRYHANPQSGSTLDRTKVGWYTQFVRGTLSHALIGKDTEMLEVLLKLPQHRDMINDIDQEGQSLLHLCVLNNTPEYIELLVRNGADLRQIDFDGFTAIHRSVVLGNLTCLQTFFSLNPKPDLGIWHPIHQNREPKFLREQSCLWLAALLHYKSNPEVMEKMMRLFMNSVKNMPSFLDERSEKNDCTLLDYCCINVGMEKIVEVLIDLGVTIDLPNLDGLTPLTLACQSGNTRVITLLLKSGAQPNLRTHKHNLMSSLFYCRGGSGLDCARELVSYGARWNDMKAKDGQRIKDLFPSTSQQQFLRQSEEVFTNKPVVETSEPMKPPANSMPQNNRHDFDSCAICQLEFSMVNKREYCRRCGWNVCGPCSTKRCVFGNKGAAANGANGKKAASSASSSSSNAGGNKERVCDGCYNIVAYKKKPGSTANGKKKRGGDSDDDAAHSDEDVATAASFRKKGAKPAHSDDEDELPISPKPNGKHKPERSAFKSIKRMDVDSEDDDEDDDDEEGNGKKHGSDSEGTVTEKLDVKAKDGSPKSTLKRIGSIFSRKKKDEGEKKDDASTATDKGKKDAPKTGLSSAKAEAEKQAASAKQKGRDSEEDDDNYEGPKGKKKPAPKKRRDDDDDEEDEPPRRSNKVTAGRRNGNDDDDAPRGGRQPGWSSRGNDDDEDNENSRSGDRTDSDGDVDPYSDEAAAKSNKGNIFQRGFKSATGAVGGVVKSAGGVVKSGATTVVGAAGGAMSSVARGVKKVAGTIQEKVTAVAVPVDEDGNEIDPDEHDEEDFAAIQKERRKREAAARLRRKGYKNESDEDEPPAKSSSASKSTASTHERLADARLKAQRQRDLMKQMEDKGADMEDEANEFADLSTKLKNKKW